MRNFFRYFNSPPEVIRITVMLSIRYTLSLRQIEGHRSGARAATSPCPRNCFPPSLPVT